MNNLHKLHSMLKVSKEVRYWTVISLLKNNSMGNRVLGTQCSTWQNEYFVQKHPVVKHRRELLPISADSFQKKKNVVKTFPLQDVQITELNSVKSERTSISTDCSLFTPYGTDKVSPHTTIYALPNSFSRTCISNDSKIRNFSCISNLPCRQFSLQPYQRNVILTTNKHLQQSQRLLSLSPKGLLDASPQVLQPYLRLIRFDKPIGTWLLYWPCTWSIALAASPGHIPDLWLLGLFGLGSFFMRGAGCIINDMWDKDIDKKVERTKLRPLASGELSPFQGLLCLGTMLSVSLGILLQLNWYSVLLGAASMGLVVIYPLAKRYTYWPQAVLGVTLNWGVLLAWSAIHGSIQLPVIPLYIACVFYTMIYDSIYSHQDKYDDLLIGVKSTALKFGEDTKKWLCGFGVIMTSGLAATGVMCDQTWPYFLGVAMTASHLAHQLYTVNLDNADDCASKFRSNTQLGFVMFLAIVLGTLLKEKRDGKMIKEKEK